MKNRGFTVIELSVVVAIFFIMIAILTPFIRIAKSRAARIGCANNVMRVSLALHKYAKEHKGTFPARLADLYPKYIKEEKVFDCPGSKSVGTGLNPDYIYTPGLRQSSPGNTIMAQDLDTNHKGKRKNILRVDGSVEWADNAKR
jgi:prepilin-type N-terminal cleavage/methylation domain-containing protein/prepilin-type processing-associated H-X9-DG protein